MLILPKNYFRHHDLASRFSWIYRIVVLHLKRLFEFIIRVRRLQSSLTILRQLARLEAVWQS